MKKFKLIVKFFFEQKCHEIWKFIKKLPISTAQAFLALLFLLFISGVVLSFCCFIGYLFSFIVPELKSGKDVFECYAGAGLCISFITIFTCYAVYSFVNWIKENVALARERAEKELGLSRYSSTQFPNISSKVKYREK